MKTNARLTSIISRYTGNTIVAHEFNYNVTNQLIYDNNGVQVYSNPAFHYNLPGPVSLKLVWNNITIAYSGSHQPSLSCYDCSTAGDHSPSVLPMDHRHSVPRD